MSHIYIYSPSGAVRDRRAFRRGIARLKALGHEVEIDEAALKSHQRFAGDDATRLAAIARAADSGADAALISRGGYGLTRILDALPYRKLATAVRQGMKLVGMSDFTALQMALLAKTGTLSWAGPALGEDFGVDGEPDEVMEGCFEDLMTGRGEGTGWRLPRSDSDAVRPRLIQGGTLWGGNLAVLASLVGTPYLPDVKGGILFLEEVHEHPYRVERMLSQLFYAGILGRQKALVLGQFTGYKPVPHDKGFKLQSVVEWLRQRVRIPVLTGLPYGHVQTKVVLPVGMKTALSIEETQAYLLWGHVH